MVRKALLARTAHEVEDAGEEGMDHHREGMAMGRLVEATAHQEVVMDLGEDIAATRHPRSGVDGGVEAMVHLEACVGLRHKACVDPHHRADQGHRRGMRITASMLEAPGSQPASVQPLWTRTDDPIQIVGNLGSPHTDVARKCLSVRPSRWTKGPEAHLRLYSPTEKISRPTTATISDHRAPADDEV